MKILAIDDNTDNLVALRAVTADAFPGAGFLTAPDGPRGIAAALAEDPDVILLDIIMPQMDGFEVCRRLKADGRLRHIPVVFLTALKTDRASRVKALEIGAEAFLSKPIEEVELTAQIRAMVKIKSATVSRKQENERLTMIVAERTRELDRELTLQRKTEADLQKTLQSLRLSQTAALNVMEDLKEENEARRKTEEALRESEKKYRLLIENLTGGIWYINEDAYTTFANLPMAEMLGYTVNEMLGKRLFEFMDSRGVEIANDNLERRKKGIKEQHEFEFVRKDGRRIYVSMETAPIVDENGHYLGSIAGVQDITDRRQAEEALRESEERYRDLFTGSRDGIVVVDDQGHFLDANAAYCAMLGCSVEELRAMNGSPRLIPEKWHTWERGIIRDHHLLQEGYSGIYEKEYIRKDGTVFPVELQSFTVFGPSGKPKYVWGIARDITERKRAEEQIYYQAGLVASIGDAIIGTDLEYNFQSWNAAAEIMYGWTAMDVLGHPMREFIRNEYPFDSLEIVTEQLLEKGHWKGEVTQNRRDGTRFPAFSSVSALKDHTDKVIGFVAVNRDITERKRLEEALAHEREELARSNAELEQFAYVASHDLQEPLRMVSSYVQLLARRYQGKLDRDAEEFIGFAADGAARMQQMIVDLLALSRLGTHGQQFAAVPCDGALDQALANLQTAIQDSKAKIKRDPLPTVMADHAQLVQLFQNLIGNALKFRGKRAPRVHISAELHAEAWVFSVRDNGIGIDPEYAERVFVLFQRLHGRSEYAGTGIGLAICKKTVGQHGGRIWVESQLNKGSTFYFSLPIAMSSHKEGDRR